MPLVHKRLPTLWVPASWDDGRAVSHLSYLDPRLSDRFPIGAPIVTTPLKDDPALGADPARNNNFKFTAGNQSVCPFAAHIRKMNPRGDLSDNAIQSHMVLRRGIPYGSEVSSEERASNTTRQERGLLFVCYQTSLTKGFSFLQQSKNTPIPPKATKTSVWIEVR